MRNEWPLPPVEIEQAEGPAVRPESSWTPPEYPPAPLPRLVHPAPIRDPALHNDVKELEMSKRTERIRWRIAALIDKLPGQCWTELVMFGLGYRRNPWSPMRSTCRTDAERCGACYCGKLRGPEDGA